MSKELSKDELKERLMEGATQKMKDDMLFDIMAYGRSGPLLMDEMVLEIKKKIATALFIKEINRFGR